MPTTAGAGCGATILHDAVMVPADGRCTICLVMILLTNHCYLIGFVFKKVGRFATDLYMDFFSVIKQRMQMYNSPYSSCFDCIRKLYRAEGIKAFYRSFTTQMAMNVPFHAIHIVTYEKFQNILNVNREYNPKAHVIAGAAAGAVAAACTTPLDMCKTVLNTQETSALIQLQQSRVVGITGALRTIYLMNGIPGFFKGIHARILYQMPGTAISWSIYELFKHQLSKASRSDSAPSHWDSDLRKDSVVRETRSELESSSTNPTDGKEKRIILGSTTNKTVERLRSLHMPGLTASCAAADDNFLSK